MKQSDLTFEPSTHTFRLGDRVIPSITQILQAQGLINTDYFTLEGRERGRLVHLACQFYDEGCLDWKTVDPRIVGYVRAWEKFRRESHFNPDASEVPLYSETLLFAGIPDRWTRLYEKRQIVEIKTGVIAPWVALQTAAQDLLINDSRYSERMAVQLKPDGNYTTKQFAKHIQDRQWFLAELRCYKLRQDRGVAA